MRFLNIKEIAQRMDKKPSTIHTYRSRGEFTLPMVKVGRMLGCFESDFETWLKNNGRAS